MQEQIKEGASDQNFSLVSLAAEHGYTLKAAEANRPGERRWNERSDCELKFVPWTAIRRTC